MAFKLTSFIAFCRMDYLQASSCQLVRDGRRLGLRNFDFKFNILPIAGVVQYLRTWQLWHFHPASDCILFLLLSVPHYWSFPNPCPSVSKALRSLPSFICGVKAGVAHNLKAFKKIHWQLEKTVRRNTCKGHFAPVLHLRSNRWCPLERKACSVPVNSVDNFAANI